MDSDFDPFRFAHLLLRARDVGSDVDIGPVHVGIHSRERLLQELRCMRKAPKNVLRWRRVDVYLYPFRTLPLGQIVVGIPRVGELSLL